MDPDFARFAEVQESTTRGWQLLVVIANRITADEMTRVLTSPAQQAPAQQEEERWCPAQTTRTTV